MLRHSSSRGGGTETEEEGRAGEEEDDPEVELVDGRTLLAAICCTSIWTRSST